jgi:hypothetical protein
LFLSFVCSPFHILLIFQKQCEVSRRNVCCRPSQEVRPEEKECSENSYILEKLPLEEQYLAAECLGKSDGNCETAYPDCPNSPLDMISQKLNVEMITE